MIKNICIYVYSGYGMTFDSAGPWSFDNDFATLFCAVNSSSSHFDNRKNNFLILGECPIDGINESFGLPEKKFNINFSKRNTKFFLGLHCNAGNSYFFVNGKEIFKVCNKNVNFPTQGITWKYVFGFSAIESRDVSLNENVSIQSTILLINRTLNINKYLMTKNNIK